MKLIKELYDLDCIIYANSEYHSDYMCRYCSERTKTNVDHTIEHRAGCLWLKIKDASSKFTLAEKEFICDALRGQLLDTKCHCPNKEWYSTHESFVERLINKICNEKL